MIDYTAIVFKDPDSGFAVTFPDLPGCVAFAQTLPDVPRIAWRALSVHFYEMRKAGELIPAATAHGMLASNPDYADGMAIEVEGVPELRLPGARQLDDSG
jgi:predicted RNase H-like HicB family nuclease